MTAQWYSGHNGQVLVEDDHVTIDRGGLGGRVGSSRQRIRIARADLIDVHHKLATRMINGWVRLEHTGSQPPAKLQYKDPDLVIYTWQQRKAFDELVKRVTPGPSFTS